MFNEFGNDINEIKKYNYLINNSLQNATNISDSNNKINYDNFSLNKKQKEKSNDNNEKINENILLKSKISSLEKEIYKYKKENNELNNYINIFYNFFKNIDQISMNQLNIDIKQFNNKLIDINLFQNILNKIESYINFLQSEINNLTQININNNDRNEIHDEYANNQKEYEIFNIQNNNAKNNFKRKKK